MKRIFYILAFVVSLASCKQYVENRNEEASLPEWFDFEKMNLKAINSIINPSQGTTSILYGNNGALQSLKFPDQISKAEKLLVLITWNQQDDPRWFGAKIPSGLKMIEVLKTKTDFYDQKRISYHRYDAKGQVMKNDNIENENRIKLLTSIRPAVMP